MRVTDPEHMSRAFAEAFNARDLEKLLSLYERYAVYVTPSRTVSGSTDIGEVFLRLFAVKGVIELTNKYCHSVGDIALVRASWRFTGSDASGRLIETQGHSSEVLRRQPDGGWQYLIDHPTGGD